jgi:hypothetical protein
MKVKFTHRGGGRQWRSTGTVEHLSFQEAKEVMLDDLWTVQDGGEWEGYICATQFFDGVEVHCLSVRGWEFESFEKLVEQVSEATTPADLECEEMSADTVEVNNKQEARDELREALLMLDNDDVTDEQFERKRKRFHQRIEHLDGGDLCEVMESVELWRVSFLMAHAEQGIATRTREELKFILSGAKLSGLEGEQ